PDIRPAAERPVGPGRDDLPDRPGGERRGAARARGRRRDARLAAGPARPADRARPLLRASAALARQLELAAMEMQNSWALAMAAEQIGADADAAEHARAVLARWRRTEDRH